MKKLVCAAVAAIATAAVADITITEPTTINASTTCSENVTVCSTLTVSGSSTTMTLAKDKTISVTPGAGNVVVTDGAKITSPSDNSFVVAAEAGGATVESGVADVLEVNGGSTITLDFKNNATATGRVSVASGLVQFNRRGGWKYGNATFIGSSWIVDVAESATGYFYHGDQGGHFNDEGTSVIVQGAGNLRLGQAYYHDAGGSFAVKKGAAICNTGDLEFYGIYGESLDGGGDIGGLFEFKTGAKVDGPRKMSINGNSGSKAVILQVNEGADFTARDIDFVRTGGKDQICGDGVINLDASAADISVAANVPTMFVCKVTTVKVDDKTNKYVAETKANTITFQKLGANNATMSVTNIPALVVSAGTVTLTNDCVIGDLSIADGAKVVVDGATLTYAAPAGLGGTIELKNGAKGIRIVTGTEGEESGMDRSGLTSDSTLLKTGDTDLIVYDPTSVTGLVHVAGGALRFSKRGLSDKFFRLTVKECYPWGGDATSASAYPGLLLKVGLYSAADTLIDTESGSSATNGTAASDLNENQWAVPVGTLFKGFGQYYSVASAFSGDLFPKYSYVGAPCFTNATKTLCKNASDESGWLTIWGRLKSTWAALDGINFVAGWGWGIEKTWTVETSPTGVDGSWRVVQEIVDMPHKLGSNNGYIDDNTPAVLNADKTKPAAHFRYMEPGVTGLADVLQIRVDAGATLDFSAKTGGQSVDRIYIDATAGTVKNVAFAETGVIELVGESDGKAKGLLPLVFDGVSGTENLKNWTVVCGEKTLARRVKFSSSDSKLTLESFGMIMIVR